MTKEEIKKWLKDHKRDRNWLAEKCGVNLSTVNSWLSTDRGIASKAILTIQRLMNEDTREERVRKSLPVLPTDDKVTIVLDRDIQLSVAQQAAELGMTISEWTSLAVEQAMGESDIYERILKRYLEKKRKAAESPGEYDGD